MSRKCEMICKSTNQFPGYRDVRICRYRNCSSRTPIHKRSLAYLGYGRMNFISNHKSIIMAKSVMCKVYQFIIAYVRASITHLARPVDKTRKSQSIHPQSACNPIPIHAHNPTISQAQSPINPNPETHRRKEESLRQTNTLPIQMRKKNK
jgi:hypothetical protein